MTKEEQIAEALKSIYQIKHFSVEKGEDGIEFKWKIQHGRELRAYGCKIDSKCIEVAWWIMVLESATKSMRKAVGLEGYELWPLNETDPLTGLPMYGLSEDPNDKPEELVELEDEDFVGSDIK